MMKCDALLASRKKLELQWHFSLPESVKLFPASGMNCQS
jgi:hypothetical protein